MEAGEADRVEDLPLVIAEGLVERPRPGEQVDERCHRCDRLIEPGPVCLSKLGFDRFALRLDALDLRGELLGGPVGITDQIEHLVLQGGEALALALEIPLER
ncbi:hypothetical protein [Glycomyces sp. MUSA5-2]|uniref:hypothetical protein n=1 Tax=Glycomyces sp. MUSA5-2 TaxID=2053002 RepID=UPI00300BC34D